MLKSIFIASVNLFKKAFGIKDKTETELAVIVKDEKIDEKNKILFQPNTLAESNPIECPIQTQPLLTKQLPVEIKPGVYSITLECNYAAISHLESLCRFFEVSQTDALSRGVWLLSLTRDIEMNNKKLGVITTDNNGVVVDVAPIDLV